MEIKYNETGRSMVEILGVLAVIGVLSVGGIMGYRYAMDKYQANDIISSVKMRSSDIWHRYQDKELPNTTEEPKAFAEWSDTTQTGFTITIETIPEIGGFQVVARSIPNGICKQIMNMSTGVIGQDGIKFVNVDTGETLGGISLCEGEETKSIVFTSFLSETNADGKEVGECIIDSQCSSVCGESICDKENGYICSSGCGEKEVCNTETQTCEEIDVCVEGSEFRSKTGACISCVAKGGYEISSKDEPWLEVALNIQDTASGKEQCSKCGRSVEEVNGKTYCTTVCLVGKGYIPVTGVKNTGEITQYAENDYINGCVSCDNPNDYAINDKSAEALAGCTACGHSTYWTKFEKNSLICGPMVCKSEEFKHFPALNGSGHYGAQCISCKDPSPRYIGEVEKFKTICEAETCGRKAVGKWCVPTSCGTNEFLSASYPVTQNQNISLGGCQSCQSTNAHRLGEYIQNKNESTGEVTYSIGADLQYFITQCNKCNDKNKDGIISEEEKDSVRKIEQGSDGFAYCVPSTSSCDGILGSDGTCYACTEKKVLIISDEASGCTKNCKDTNGQTSKWTFQENTTNSMVCMDKCKSTQFQGYDGKCYDCSRETYVWNGAVAALKESCESCPSSTPRIQVDQRCFKRETCEKGKTFYNYNADNPGCVSCDTIDIVVSNNQEYCEACPAKEGVHQGRVYYYYYDRNTKYCIPKIQDVSWICTAGEYFKSGWNGKCIPCSSTEATDVKSFKNECKSCGEQRQLNGSICQINNGCNGGSTFWSTPSYTCVTCDTSGVKIETSYDERHLCDLCSQKRSMTLEVSTVQDGETVTETKAYCVQKCSANKWQDSAGNCYACNKNNGKGNIIGIDSVSKKLCTDCNRTVAMDNSGNTICQ